MKLCIQVTALLLPLAVSARAEQPLVRWTIAGETDSLQIAAVQWKGSVEGDLAAALVNYDAAVAAPMFRRLADRNNLPDDLLAVVWQRLYGYALITGDGELRAKAADWLNSHPQQARPLFHDSPPEPDATENWTVQIGAFSDKANAERLGALQSAKGFTVQITPVVVSGTTLYAVRVGQFRDPAQAESFAQQVYAPLEMGYRVVEAGK